MASMAACHRWNSEQMRISKMENILLITKASMTCSNLAYFKDTCRRCWIYAQILWIWIVALSFFPLIDLCLHLFLFGSQIFNSFENLNVIIVIKLSRMFIRAWLFFFNFIIQCNLYHAHNNNGKCYSDGRHRIHTKQNKFRFFGQKMKVFSSSSQTVKVTVFDRVN